MGDPKHLDDLLALVAAKRAEMGIVVDDASDGPPADDVSMSAVEEELANTSNAVASAVLQRRVERAVGRQRERANALQCPTGPELSVVDLVHRGHDGFIPFAARNTSGAWQELGCVPAKVLRGLFGADWLTKELDVDSYFGLHGMFPPWALPSSVNAPPPPAVPPQVATRSVADNGARGPRCLQRGSRCRSRRGCRAARRS